MKRLLKSIVVAILASQVRRLQKRHPFKVVGVVGGIGKTSTKVAIAQLLSTTVRVRYQAGNYNDIVTVPLIFFGHDNPPNLANPLAWIKIFINNAKQLRGDYPYDVVVVELGTDRVGQIAAFQKYVKLDYAVITAIVPEHMEYFGDMQTVATEELSVTKYADKLIYNTDLVPKAYRQPLKDALSYGIKLPANYQISNISRSKTGFEANITNNERSLHFSQDVVSETQLYSTLAAVAVGTELGLTASQIRTGIGAIQPVSGRLQRLRGINNSLIIDDTYNALPSAMKASLEMLYSLQAPQKIAILGTMNQLGALSAEAHTEIGALCDPAHLNLVVTIGPDAKTYLAPAAKARGCVVKSFDTPYEAGKYVRSQVQPGAIILAKGSQDKVYAEEAIKVLLADPADAAQLVRQSKYWQKVKQANFA